MAGPTKLDTLEREAMARFPERVVAASAVLDLPDLSGDGSPDVVPDNVLSMAALYFAAMLDSGKVIAAADAVADGVSCEPCVRHRHARSARLTEAERRAIYAHAFGFATGPSYPLQLAPNREYSDVWHRALSSFATAPTSEESRRAGRELAVHLSTYGYGAPRQVAREMRALVESTYAVLSDATVLAKYDARSPWQVVSIVSSRALGGAAKVDAERAKAVHGALVMEWLATHAGHDASAIEASARAWLEAAGVSNVEIERLARTRSGGPARGWPAGFAPICMDAPHKIVPCMVQHSRKR
jgi:hypothetical protein